MQCESSLLQAHRVFEKSPPFPQHPLTAFKWLQASEEIEYRRIDQGLHQ